MTPKSRRLAEPIATAGEDWNAKKLGPKRDLLGEWPKAAPAEDKRFFGYG